MIKTLLSLAIASFLFVSFLACSGKKENNLKIIFGRVDNLDKNSPVKIHGIDVGKVTDLGLVDTGVLVRIKLSNKRMIPTGSKFSIINPLIGVSYIDIDPSNSNIFLTPKDTIFGIYGERGLLDNLLSDSVTRNKIKEAYNKIAEGIQELIEAKNNSRRDSL